MLLATIVLLGAIPQSGDLARSIANVATEVSAENRNDAASSRSLPSMPMPKVKTDAEPDGVNSSLAANLAGAAAVQTPRVTLSMQPVKQAYTRPREIRGQRIAWYTLAVTGHGAAAFDAYSTRRALSGGYGTEGNPFLRPFANSNALYAVTQISPAVMDFLGKRMMVSENRWVRRMWWLPQAAGSGFSIGAGVHNMGVVK
ncbi:MAG: hypothetical protein JWO71_2243 [Candidatus Acidoferrum typicum]|nr:hypothetical protein [Candidatus Acidoferrum typicum]